MAVILSQPPRPRQPGRRPLRTAEWRRPRPWPAAGQGPGPGGRRQADPGHPAAVQRGHASRQPRPAPRRRRRQPAQRGHHEARRPSRRARPAARTRPVRRSRSRLSRPSTSAGRRRRPARLGRGVVLVVDLPDQLLDQVLQRDDAGGAAVLVDHQREVVAGPAHLGQRGQHALARRQPRAPRGSARRRVGAGRRRGGSTGRAGARSRPRRRGEPWTTGNRECGAPRTEPRPPRRWSRSRPGRPPRSAAPSARGRAGRRRPSTSSIRRRSSRPSTVFAATRSRSWASLIRSRPAVGLAPEQPGDPARGGVGCADQQPGEVPAHRTGVGIATPRARGPQPGSPAPEWL